MKPKALLTIILLCIFAAGVKAQPLNWKESLYDPTKTSVIAKESGQKSEGNYSLKYTYTDPGVVYFLCDTFLVTAGASYNFSVDYLDNDPNGLISARLWFHASPTTAYLERKTTANTVDSPNWQTLTLTGTVPATATIAVVAIRMSPANASTFTSAAFYADNVKYTEGTGSNKIKNPGFENWVIPAGSTLQNWKESLYDPAKTSVIVPEQKIVKDGASSVKYTFTDPGVPYLLCDTFNVTTGQAYNFSIDYLDNDPNGLISARLWFHASPKTAYLERKTTSNTVDSPDWQTLSLTGTVPATATIAVIAVRMSVANASTFTSATFYADNAKYLAGTNTTNLIVNGSFENWKEPVPTDFITFKFAGLNPVVNGVINKSNKTVSLEVPYATNLTALVATYTVSDGVTVKVGSTDQVSGTTANNFTNPVKYTLTKGSATQEWTVTVTKTAASTAKEITSFKFDALVPPVSGTIDATAKTISLEVPNGTNVTALVPTIVISPLATVLPASGAAQNFTSTVNYTVTAQDGSTQVWKATVTFGVPGQTVLFYEDFDKLSKLPATWVVINNDKYLQASGEERWQDSAWVVGSTSRTELKNTKVAMSSSFTTNMPLTGRADDWMIIAPVQLGNNSTLSWNAMSTTSSGNYPDDYVVYIAPFTAGVTPTVTYFEENANELIKIAPEQWSATLSNPGAGLASRSINLKNKKTPDAPNGWFDKKVWIAFVNTTDLYTNPKTGIPNTSPGGSNLAIDNIKIVNDIVSGIREVPEIETRVFPNPARNEIFIEMNVDACRECQIGIMDITGREVISIKEKNISGFYRKQVNISSLGRGVYFVRTRCDDSMGVVKLVVQK